MALEIALDYRLRWLDFDRYGRIQPVTLLDMFQDVATLHANEMGIGRDDMLEHGVFWAIIRMKYEMMRNPENFHTVRVRAWPHTPSSFSFCRDFEMTDEDGDVLAKATSEWVLMDVETRKFAKMKDYYHGQRDFSDKRAFGRKPRKIVSFEGVEGPVRTVVPAFSDIDVNGHVNNARYLRFVMDALNPGDHEAIRSLQIDYRHEVLPDSPLAVHTFRNGDTVSVKGVRDDGEVAFACVIELTRV